LLKGARSKETGRRNGKYIFAGCGQTRCNPDQVLFRYANFYDLAWRSFRKRR
jgi:hypothetical protein